MNKRNAVLTSLALATLLVAAAPAQTLVVTPNPLTLTAQSGGSPVTASINVTSSDGVTVIPFNAASQVPWMTLSARPASGWQTPATIQVSVDPTNSALKPGANSGSIGFVTNSTNFVVTVNVTVSTLSVSPQSVDLGSYAAGSTVYPTSQTIVVTGAGTSGFTVSSAPGDFWYTAAAFGTPLQYVAISFNSANASSLTPSSTPLQGTLTITPNGSNPIPITVPIKLRVVASPQVTVTPGSLTFNWQAGGTNNQKAQILTLSSNSPQPVNFSATVNTNWLTLPTTNPTIIPANGSVQITVQVNGANQQTTSGAVQFNIQQGGALFSSSGTTQLTLPVQLNVSIAPLIFLTSSPSLSYTFQFGTASFPGSQTVSVASTGAPDPTQQVTYTVAVSSNAPWLTVIPPPGSQLTTPATFSAAVNTSQLSPGTYTGTITVTNINTGTTQQPISIPVTLTVGFTPILQVSATQLIFPFEVGQAPPGAQTINLASSTGAPLNYTVTVPSVSWLQVTGPLSGTTDQTFFTVTPLTTGLTAQASALDATITVVATDPTTGATINTIPIDVKLYATSTPVLVVSPPGPLILSVADGNPVASSCGQGPLCIVGLSSSSPATGDVLTITGAQGTVANQAITGDWLGLTVPNGNTPTTFNVNATQLSAQTMPAGTYNGTVTVTANNSSGPVADSPYVVPVIFNINTANGSVNPQTLQFSQVAGGSAPAAQTVQVTTDGPSLAFSAVVNTGLANWLTISKISGPTPGSFNVSANAANLTTGTYHGAIYVSIPNAQGNVTMPNGAIRIPVTFSVQGGSISAPATPLAFTQIVGGAAAAAQTVQVTSTPNAVGYTVNAQVTSPANGTWLTANITAGNGNTPGTVTVSVTPGTLGVGNYTGNVVINSPGTSGSPITIPVTLAVVQASISASTTPLTFNQLAGGPAPAAQSVPVTSTPAGVGFQVSTATNSGGGWLNATVGNSTSGTAPATVQISVNGGTLAAGAYSGVVTITAANATGSPVSIPVGLTVGASSVLTSSQTTLTFSAVVGQAAQPQTVTLTASGSTQFTIVSATTNGGNWLTAAPSSGTASSTPVTLTISANTQGLAAGSYTGTVTISSANSISPVVINVSLTMQAIPAPVIVALKNAASYVTGAVSPGENIVIGGTGIGPAQLVGAQLTSNGALSTNVGSTQVTFDGVPAPIIYASATQTAVMVPYEIGGRTITNIQVTYSGVPSATLSYNISPTVPGIYTQNLQGFGPGVILNADGVTVNGPNTPAPPGSEIAIYMTGEGATSPASTTGGVAATRGNGLNTPVQKVTATVGGVAATVAYSGSAPGIVYGVMQVNIVIPPGTPSGAQQLVISVGGTPTQSNVTVQVQ